MQSSQTKPPPPPQKKTMLVLRVMGVDELMMSDDSEIVCDSDDHSIMTLI